RRAVASAFRYPINRSDGPVYPGSLLHHLLHALDLAADRSCPAARLPVEADSARTRSIENSAAGERGIHSYWSSCGCWVRNFSAAHARRGMASEGTARFDGTATQASAGQKIRGASEPGYRRNREAYFK